MPEESPVALTQKDVDALNQTITSLLERVRAVESAGPSFKSPKVQMPEKFDGNNARFRDFMVSIENYFTLQADRFPIDMVKTRFVGSLLLRDALSWFRTLVETNSPLLESYEEFVQDFRQNFGDPHAQRHAQIALARLKQGRASVSSFAARFRRISIDTGYNDLSLIERFRNGLNDDVKDVLATALEEPVELEPFISLCVRIDDRLYGRRLEKMSAKPLRYNGNEFKQPFRERKDSNAGPVPMELDSTAILPGNRSKLTQEERQRRLREKLCLYCAKPGHRAVDCPEAKNVKSQK